MSPLIPPVAGAGEGVAGTAAAAVDVCAGAAGAAGVAATDRAGVSGGALDEAAAAAGVGLGYRLLKIILGIKVILYPVRTLLTMQTT